MSCPDWQTLAAWRDDPQADEPAEWREALAHLDRGCARCRRAAIAADPTLVFRRLAVVAAAAPATGPAQEASEAEAMRRAVAAMRAASRVEASERRASSWSWKRWGTAAALAVLALSMPGDDARLRREPAGTAPLAVALPAAMFAEGPGTALAAPGDDLPTLEGVNRPGARVYHMDGEGMSVVMIVDETLDV